MFNHKRLKLNFKLLGLSCLAMLMFVLLKVVLTPTVATQASFKLTPISVNTYDLYDIGVANVNSDDYLDIFTANHSALQTLAINEGSGTFVDQLSASGLGQDRQFPGIEVSPNRHSLDKPGLSIYREPRLRESKQTSDNALVLQFDDGLSTQPLKGKLTLASAAKVNQNKGFTATLTEHKKQQGYVETTVEFAVQRQGKLVLETDLTALPTQFEVDKTLPLDQIYLGTSATHPSAHNFELTWRDRHGMAWADYTSDNKMDVFITRGGLKGKLEAISDANNGETSFFTDELFQSTAEQFQDIAATTGLEKKDCPGRQVASADINRDNKLDLYIVCGRGVPPLGESPNQLYQQAENGIEFKDVAAELGLDFPEKGTFAWIDVNLDQRVDFLWANEKSFQVFLNQPGGFKVFQTLPHSHGRIKKFSIADFDLDGDLDIFAIGLRDSTLLMKDGDRFTPQQPSNIGLPNQPLTGNWVDYNNDGQVDFHAVPGGMYRQMPNHRFKATGLLKHAPRFSKIIDARSSWFDVNNDGLLDMLVALHHRPLWLSLLNRLPGIDRPDLRGSEVGLYIQVGNHQNNWLQIKLEGNAGNRQAIGAQVEMDTGDSTRAMLVGQSEGTHFSQGHYRLYAGLGTQKNIRSLKVIWPDGQAENFLNLPVNRLTVLEQGTGQ